MREEKWMLTDELFSSTREEAPEVIAFRMLQEADWVHFVLDVEGNPSMRFFNPELREFSRATDWEDLSVEYGIAPYIDELTIPDEIPEAAKSFCRDIRASMRHAGEEWCGGCKAFYSPREWVDHVSLEAVMVVCHDGGGLAPRFNMNYEQLKLYNQADSMLSARGLWREHQNSAVTHIYKS